MEPVRIERFIPGGQALGTLESGKKVMLWGALPGELVTKWHITKNKSSYCEGIADEVTDKSTYRVEPKDECYLSTSPWQVCDFDYELEQKRELVLETFRQQRVNYEDLEIGNTITDGNEYFYRNKMEYALYYKHEDAKIYPAFRMRGTHQKVPVVQSSLEHPAIWQSAQKIITDLNVRHEDVRKYQSLLLRSNSLGEVSGGLIENRKPHSKFANLKETILGLDYALSPNGFFQINTPVYELALREMRQWITTDSVLDLYAGVGTIGLSVTRDNDLVLVECDKYAYSELEKNCQGTSAKPILAKSEEALEYIQQNQTVIIDPPRAGCSSPVVEKLMEIAPKSIIYLSCNPITQARDLKDLIKIYQLIFVCPFNFFPHTPHTENLVILERR